MIDESLYTGKYNPDIPNFIQANEACKLLEEGVCSLEECDTAMELGYNMEGPIHYIQNRIKKKKSLEEKLIRRGKEPTVDNAKDYLQDIAGVRIICYFVDDIYNLAKSLKRQADLIVIREQDYIKAPKPNGYRSYHLIVGVPVYCMDGMEYFPVEV